MTPRRLLIGVFLAALVAAVAVFGLEGHSLVGTLAKPLPSQTLVGPEVTLAAVRGRPALVVFWASWCGPCQHEAPTLERFWRGLRGTATLIGVDWSDPVLTSAHAFVKRYGWTFPNLRDSEGTVGNSYGIGGLPTTFVIDSGGHIHQVLNGPQSLASLRGALASL
jgi:cytochrome c biogenesis protein CcmG/thiol:disulfide interchange protein DsbE